jgi:hypothetical protein
MPKRSIKIKNELGRNIELVDKNDLSDFKTINIKNECGDNAQITLDENNELKEADADIKPIAICDDKYGCYYHDDCSTCRACDYGNKVCDNIETEYANAYNDDVDDDSENWVDVLDEDDVDLGNIHGEGLIYTDQTGINVDVNNDDVRSFNVGASDYSQHKIQPWDIWEEYNLNPWEADIIKRVLRKKNEGGLSEIESRILDFEKIIHISRKCIEMLEKKKYN